MRYHKVNGLGNDFCVISRDEAPDWSDERWSKLAVEICDREQGVGADGLLLIGPPETRDEYIAAATMRIINADGSPSEMCGNGLRAVGRLLVEQGRARAGGSLGFVIETDAGPRWVWVHITNPGLVRTTLGESRLGAEAVGADPDHCAQTGHNLYTAAGETLRLAKVGNPHAIIETEAPLTNDELARRGAAIERDAAFPDRINAQFVRIESEDAIRVQSWERGAGATKACGTGAAAAVAALHDAGLVRSRVEIHLPGETLIIEITPDGTIVQEGPAAIEGEGDWPVEDDAG